MSKIFQKDEMVMTPGGLAKVVYHRMSDFNPSEVGSYGVRLKDVDYPCGGNTIYPACEVRLGPKYIHDCEKCLFLGQHECVEGNVNHTIDIWWCKNDSHPALTSILGRFGDDGSEYYSSHPPKAMADPHHYLNMMNEYDCWYITALELAEKKDLYDPVTMNAK